MGDIARQFCRLSDELVLTKTASTNCGENGLFTRRLLDDLHINPQIVILIQDPLMQRRTDAAFRHAWRDSRRPPRFLNWPVFVPQLVEQAGSIGYAGNHPGNLWSIDRFISLLMGEIPRLRDDEHGYGPRGRGFIPHIDIPNEVEVAYRYIASRQSASTNHFEQSRPPAGILSQTQNSAVDRNSQPMAQLGSSSQASRRASDSIKRFRGPSSSML